MRDNAYHVSGAKALVGAAFIEYMIYGVMYIIEGFKLNDFEDSLPVKPPIQHAAQ